jgi:hypothetical protein
MNEHEEIAKALKARLSELRTRNTRPRVPVTKANRQGIVDPLTALLFSAAAAGEGLSQEARARAGGVLKALLVDGEASFSTDGTIKGDYPMPTTFTSKIVSKAESSDVTMVLEEGNVKELAVTPPPSSDLVPVTKANRQGIVDPLTALLFSAAAAGEGLSQEACRRTLPIFDGHQRYDLKLAFKRMDKMTAEKGYAGPVVVCSVNYEPIAGHRANIPLVKYLSEGREIEIALAPIAGMRLLAPFRLSVVSTLANLDRGQSIRNDYGACARGHAPYRASSRHFIDANAQRWRP